MVASRHVATAEWTGGWRTLTAGFFGVGFGWIPFQIVASLFILPMQQEFGWSRAAVSIGPIGGLVTIIFYFAAGVLMDRIGPRKVAIVSMLLFGLVMVGFSVVPPNKALFFALVGLAAAIGAGASSLVFSRGLATWFNTRIGTALGIMMNGASVTSAIGLPVLAFVIANYGWRSGFIVIAAAIALLGLPPVILWFRPRSREQVRNDLGRGGGHTLREALGDRQFWTLFLAFLAAALPIGGFLAHLQPLLIGKGIPSSTAALLGSTFAISIGLGRILVGLLLDRLNPSWVAGSALFLSALGTLALNQTTGSEGTAIILFGCAIALIGAAQGAESDYLSFFTLRLFGIGSFAPLLGILAMAVSGGMALGGLAFSLMYDCFGNYDLAVLVAAGGYAFAGVLLICIKVTR